MTKVILPDDDEIEGSIEEDHVLVKSATINFEIVRPIPSPAADIINFLFFKIINLKKKLF